MSSCPAGPTLSAGSVSEYLDLEDLLQVAERTLGGAPEIRDVGLIESALARPQASAFGEDAYLSIFEKAAALLHSLCRNHPFVDGNKRVALMGTVTFLARNELRLTCTNDEAYDLVIAIATGALDDVDEIAARLRLYSAPRPDLT